MKTILSLLRSILIINAINLCLIPSSFSKSETFTNRVTIKVPSYLFIGSDQKDVDLTFSDYHAGAETNRETVVYTLKANHMSQGDGAMALTARLDGTFENADFEVQVGSFTREGGNTSLGAVSSGFISVGESETPIAQKVSSTGDGKLLNGKVEMAYRAVATSQLNAGEQSQQLTLTLTDV